MRLAREFLMHSCAHMVGVNCIAINEQANFPRLIVSCAHSYNTHTQVSTEQSCFKMFIHAKMSHIYVHVTHKCCTLSHCETLIIIGRIHETISKFIEISSIDSMKHFLFENKSSEAYPFQQCDGAPISKAKLQSPF
jgi:hypothetical protein